MADAFERLKTALAGRYRIERELGAGGMATVYLSRDRQHERQVAIRVRGPELPAGLGGERFLCETKTTANLRDLLNRDKQLPLDEGVRISHEGADASSYIHGHDVVHRDVKRDNVIIAGRHAE